MGLQLKLTPKLSVEQQVSLLQSGLNADAIQLDKEAKIKARIDNGSITAANFNQLSQDEQNTVKLVLFKSYSPSNQDISKSLSAVEFLLVSLTKILSKSVDRTKLTTQESSFLDALTNLIDLNDMPINDTTDWRFSYLSQQFTNVQNNRKEYLQQKQSVTGSQ